MPSPIWELLPPDFGYQYAAYFIFWNTCNYKNKISCLFCLFVFRLFWDFKLGLCTCKAGALLLEPHL
jgi:hypothetical protein